jgi:hypothetical protein
VRAAIHLGYWDFAGGAVANPSDYRATSGDPLKLVHAFAKNMRPWIGAPNHALIVGNHAVTQQPMVGHIDRFADGYCGAAVASHPIVHATLDELAADPARAGHVLVMIGAVDPKAPGTHAFYDTGPCQI